MIMPLALVVRLATACAPAVAPETIAAIGWAESGFEPLAIGDNGASRFYAPASLAEAVDLAEGLLAQGHSLDLGLMQVNSGNLAPLGLSVGEALDPCLSMAAGARVLTRAYSGGTSADEQQAALRVALSRYNTGDGRRGFLNGYVRRVEAAAKYLVPALQVTGVSEPALRGSTPTSAPPVQAAVTPQSDGEWHAGRTMEAELSDRDGEWHAASPAIRHPIPVASGPPSSPASVMVLTGQSGSSS